jgi:hypothetical protein
MKYRIYPNSTPEFKMVQKEDGTMQMMIRYINTFVGYTGKWMPMLVEKENVAESKY